MLLVLSIKQTDSISLFPSHTEHLNENWFPSAFDFSKARSGRAVRCPTERLLSFSAGKLSGLTLAPMKAMKQTQGTRTTNSSLFPLLLFPTWRIPEKYFWK